MVFKRKTKEKCKSSGLPRLVLNLYILDSVVVVVVHTQPELDKHQITNAYLRIVYYHYTA